MEMKDFIEKSLAHLDHENNRPQTIKDHSTGLYLYASDFVRSFGWPDHIVKAMDEILEVMAELHDLGKYNPEWQEYLRCGKLTYKEKLEKRRDHKTLAALIYEKKIKNPYISYILQQITHAHHSGLSNRIADGGTKYAYEEADTLFEKIHQFSTDYYNFDYEPLIKHIDFERLERNIAIVLSYIGKGCKTKTKQVWKTQFFMRVMHSLICDGDFLDTEEFYDEQKSQSRSSGDIFKALLPDFIKSIHNLNAKKKKTQLNQYRQEIFQLCLNKGYNSRESNGFFLLEAPTGSGKTLSSMAFAMSHAQTHQKNRVIYVLPFVSIIEQNANVFKEFLGRDNVLEHHGNITLSATDDPTDDALNYRNKTNNIDVDNWDSPVVVTTMVQFVETLFAKQVSRNRKIHNIANSIIVFDEVQSLPLHILNPILLALHELIETYNCSVVMASATVPTFDLPNPVSIIDNPKKYYEFFEGRQNIHIDLENPVPITEMANRIAQLRQCLCVVNLRRTAQNLFMLLRERGVKNLYHLSTLMKPRHKKDVIDQIAEKLDNNEPCVVISTTVIEAGVDVDFPVVYRERATIGNYVQTMGRCNRHFHYNKGDFYIFRFEDIDVPNFLSSATSLADKFIRDHQENFKDFDNMKSFFQEWLYTQQEKFDTQSIVEMLSDINRLQFKTVSICARVIKQITKPVIVLSKKEIYHILGEDDEEKEENEKENKIDKKQVAIRLGQESIQLYPKDYDNMKICGYIIEDLEHDIAYITDLEMYDSDMGLKLFETDTKMAAISLLEKYL